MNFIAEIGQNHNGSLAEALWLVEQAAAAGATHVKSSKRTIANFPNEWRSSPYTGRNAFGSTYYDHRCALELSDAEWITFRQAALNADLYFGAGFVDADSLEFVAGLQPEFLKIPSQRVADTDLLERVPRYGIPVVLSTGMSTLAEVAQAVNILRGSLLAVLHCTSAYPTPDADLHLRVLSRFTQFGGILPAKGLSIHTDFWPAFLLAQGMGATWFEAHVTRDPLQPGSDQCFSLTPPRLADCITTLKRGEIALGDDSIKQVWASELPALKKLRGAH